MDRAFFFAYAVQELDGFREEAWKIFRQPLNRLLSISYKTKTCTDERLLAPTAYILAFFFKSS